ncbi:MAG TPA: hypothetical protein VNU64_18840 [Burkholderiales bacterium]|nr:hypothetical protein [Burkholderiales bacterium]
MENTDLLRKLKQVADNAWMLFNELPPCGARTRALHVFLDAKELKSRLEQLPEPPADKSE